MIRRKVNGRKIQLEYKVKKKIRIVGDVEANKSKVIRELYHDNGDLLETASFNYNGDLLDFKRTKYYPEELPDFVIKSRTNHYLKAGVINGEEITYYNGDSISYKIKDDIKYEYIHKNSNYGSDKYKHIREGNEVRRYLLDNDGNIIGAPVTVKIYDANNNMVMEAIPKEGNRNKISLIKYNANNNKSNIYSQENGIITITKYEYDGNNCIAEIKKSEEGNTLKDTLLEYNSDGCLISKTITNNIIGERYFYIYKYEELRLLSIKVVRLQIDNTMISENIYTYKYL